MTAVVEFFTRSNSLVVASKFSKLGIVVAHYWILEGMCRLRGPRCSRKPGYHPSSRKFLGAIISSAFEVSPSYSLGLWTDYAPSCLGIFGLARCLSLSFALGVPWMDTPLTLMLPEFPSDNHAFRSFLERRRRWIDPSQLRDSSFAPSLRKPSDRNFLSQEIESTLC
jgi:hypothetical protein